MQTVLVCDDEKDIVSALEIYLRSEGYNVIKTYNGAQALEALRGSTVHLVIMDIMMPVMDGLTALMRIREEYNVPVIFTTAKSEDHDVITGLNLGADDYVTKPFNPIELLARVRSQIRRYTRLGGSSAPEGVITVGGIEIDDAAKTVRVDGAQVALTPTEYDILRLLASNRGRVYSPADIYRAVWNEPCIGSESTVAVHIRHLREKIEIDPNRPNYIRAVWGQGYKLEP